MQRSKIGFIVTKILLFKKKIVRSRIRKKNIKNIF